MTDMPRVSIIVCSRNRASGLAQTLNTLNRIQSSILWEALLVDNASTDETAEILRAATLKNRHMRSLLCTRIGLGAAREFARANAKGRILAFTDDDCLIEPDYVDQLVCAFDRHPDAGVIGGWIGLYNPNHLPITIDERTEVVRHEPYSFIRPGAFHGANLSFRADALARAGGFDPNLGAGTPFPCEDIDAVARVVALGYAAIFDPHPRVHHDHGRTDSDLPKIMTSYSRGRGAYYAIRIVDKNTRPACYVRWLSTARDCTYFADLKNFFEESKSSWSYTRRHIPVIKGISVYVIAANLLSVAFLSWLILSIKRRLNGRSTVASG